MTQIRLIFSKFVLWNFHQNYYKALATYMDIATTNPKVLAFSREKNKHKVVFVGNFSDENQSLKNPSIGALNYDSKIKVDDKTLLLEPWGFRILLDYK